MAGMPTAVTAITLFVADTARSKEFYQRAFDVKVIFEDTDAATFRLDNALLNLLRSSAAGELVEPAEVGPDGAAARALLTITVPDVDAAVDALRRKGIEVLNGPIDRPWGVRTAAFADPDGHAWELAAPIEA